MADNPFSRLSVLSAIIVIGADLAATGFELGATFTLPIVGNIAVGLVFGVVTFILVFLNEFFVSGDLIESLLDALIFGFLVAIPTPIAGIIAGGSQLFLAQE